MLSTSPEYHHPMSFHIKHDDKFFSRLLSKETSIANPSFRVYYGDVSGSVPFTWESRPGTPKSSTFSEANTSLPPLAPPPSFYSFQYMTNHRNTKKHPRGNLLHTLLRTINLKKAPNLPTSPPSASLSSLSWSSSHSSFSAGEITASNSRGCRRFSSSGSSFDESAGSDIREMSNASTLKAGFCFGTRREIRSNGISAGGSCVVAMKKTVLSILGRVSD